MEGVAQGEGETEALPEARAEALGVGPKLVATGVREPAPPLLPERLPLGEALPVALLERLGLGVEEGHWLPLPLALPLPVAGLLALPVTVALPPALPLTVPEVLAVREGELLPERDSCPLRVMLGLAVEVGEVEGLGVRDADSVPLLLPHAQALAEGEGEVVGARVVARGLAEVLAVGD